MSEGYDIAQICLNGHCVNASSGRRPRHNQPFCDRCGEKTITECPSCRTPILGYDHGSSIGYPYHTPHHCHQCGKPYPWTERKQAAALELFIELLEVKKEEQEQLKRDLADITSDNPRTQVASVRIKRWLGKAKDEAIGALHDIVVDIASEVAKKAIWPDKP
jgi:hypothetical protein